jgi:hypothetical protein
MFNADSYLRNVLNTVVHFHPFLSLFVHALLDISRCALLVSYAQRHRCLS